MNTLEQCTTLEDIARCYMGKDMPYASAEALAKTMKRMEDKPK
jgi:hypothetical protein